MEGKSLSERKKQFLEDCCGGGPTMSGGDAMYTGGADADGPVAVSYTHLTLPTTD